MSSFMDILDELQQKITDVLKEVNANDGITCKVNNKIVKILMNSGLEKAAKNMSDSEIEEVAAIISKNAANIRSAANNLTCSLKGGGKWKGGSDDSLEDFIFINGDGHKNKKGGARRKGKAAEEIDDRRDVEDEKEEYREQDTGYDFHEQSFSPPPTPPPPSRGFRDSRRTSSPASAPAVYTDPMPTSAHQVQDLVANMDSYEILAAFYILFINGGLLATGAYSSAIDTVAPPVGEAIGLPPINSVCGIGRKQARDKIASYIGMSREHVNYMSCADAQQRWEILLISLWISLFFILAIISALGSRRMDSSAYSRGTIPMIYEVSMSGVTTLGNVLRGAPKGQESPIPFDSRNVVMQTMTNPIRALANASNSLVNSAYNLWPSRRTVQNVQANSSAAADDQQQPASTRQRLALEPEPSESEPEPSEPEPKDLEKLREARLRRFNASGGRKKRKTHRGKARKSKKAQRTRKKVQSKTRNVKKSKKAKKARKTKRR